jgi:hypothetical protein
MSTQEGDEPPEAASAVDTRSNPEGPQLCRLLTSPAQPVEGRESA